MVAFVEVVIQNATIREDITSYILLQYPNYLGMKQM